MSSEASVQVSLTNEQGWQKRFSLPAGVHWVGSAASAQIQIPAGEEIFPYHLQIVNNPSEACIRLINLSTSEIILQKGESQSRIEGNGFLDLFGHATIYLGAYTLQFDVNKVEQQKRAILEQQQKVMGVRLVLSDVILRPSEMPLIGTLYLQNLGNEPCQFEVELDGLPSDCYEILPPPLIYAGGEESTEIRIFHRHVSPPAGIQHLTLKVSAPAVYPGKEIRLEQNLKVLACYEHTLRLIREEEEQAQDLAEGEMQADFAEKAVFMDAAQLPKYQVDETVKNDLCADAFTSTPEHDLELPVDRIEIPSYSALTETNVNSGLQPTLTPADFSSGEVLAPKEESISSISSLPKQETASEVQDTTDEEMVSVTSLNLRKLTRMDLSSVRVMKATSGEFLEKKDGQG